MKGQLDDANYESMISKLAKGSIDEKSQCLKKLLFLYENARSRIYLYERRITQSLELSLLIEEKDISLNALSLLEKIIINTSTESDIMNTIKKRLLSKIVLNLGSIEIAIRKISHKCILEYVRKFRDYEAVTTVYLKTAIQQSQNFHLKLKAINSYHSLLMGESKYFTHQNQASRQLLEQLIHASYQKQMNEIRRASLLCLIFVLKIKGSQNNLRNITQQTEHELFQLKYQYDQLSSLLDLIMKYKSDNFEVMNEGEQSQPQNNTPSPKFISIQETEEMKAPKKDQINLLNQIGDKIEKIQKNEKFQKTERPQKAQKGQKIFNQVSYAEQFLKKLQKNQNWEFDQIQDFAPFLEKCLIDQSIKLFSISKKIVQVIFNSEGGKKKQYYVVLVPCIVNGIGNKRFIVKKNLEKLVRQYIKNHTQVWVKNFIDRFASTKNSKVKQVLIDLLMHAYRTSPEFYYPTQRTFEVFDSQINDNNSSLKRKVIDCIVLILERQGKDEKSRQEMLQVFSADPYSKIIRKMGKTNNSLGSYSEEAESQTIEPISPINFRKDRKHRLITAEPEKVTSIEKSQEKQQQKNVSEDKYKNKVPYRQKKVRNSHIEINFKLKKSERRSKESKDEKQKISQQKLPKLKQMRNSSSSKHDVNQSPVKKSIGQKNILYVERQNLKSLQNPKSELQKALIDIKDTNWSTQFESISKLRAIIQFNKQLITDQVMAFIVNELLQCLNNLRSGVTKLALMCLGEMMRKFHKKMYSFSESIVLTIMKKSITTSQFMQDEIRKCIITSAEELCIGKVISALNSMRDSKSTEIKLTFLQFVDVMIKSDKIYKKQNQWIWTVLIDFHEQPQSSLRNQCKRLVKVILENYKDWKSDVMQLKKNNLEKIDKILKNLNAKGENLWIQVENHEFQKAILSKVMTSKYFSNSYSKFQELDKSYTLKKNWKERIKLLSDFFQTAFDYPSEFQLNTNAKKYIQIACDQIDQKNPGVLLNSLNNLMRSVDSFPNIVEECIGQIMQKCVIVIETKRVELVSIATKMLNKIYSKYDVNKVIKQYLKLCVSNTTKVKGEIINQMIALLKENEQKQPELRAIREISLQRNNIFYSQGQQAVSPGLINQNCQNILIKSLIKLCSEKSTQNGQGTSIKLKELLLVCQRRFGQEFTNKIMANGKIVQLLA